MSAMKVGALFAGYGGIELALASVFDTEPAWFSEFDAAPSKILAHHWPDVPNLGDVTKIDWASVEPVDIITGGSPCQDLSHAGKRKGMKAGTRSGLWASMCDAIDIIRPRLVIWENVRGAYSAAADSAVEPCPICVGDGRGTHLRALGRVLGDLSELGYDARWYGLRAADVGAAHGRFRVFLFATPADAGHGAFDWERPRAEPRVGGAQHGLTLLPTPAVNDMGEGKTVDAWDAWTAKMQAAHGNGNGHGKSLAIEAQRLIGQGPLFRTPTAQLAVNGGSQHPDKRKAGGHGPTLADEVEHLLPTPRATDGTKGGPNQRGSSGDLMLPSAVQLLPTPTSSDAKASGSAGYSGNEFCTLTDATVRQPDRWGEYAPAIARWESVLGRPAPAPTETSAKGSQRLSAAFVEWLMGLPAGWVTDVPGLSRNDQLKALGNGVVPQQCAAALRAYIRDEQEAAEPALFDGWSA